MRSSITRLAALGACLGVAALPAAADASGGYHMSRDFSANGDTARAYGKICTGSKYGKWRWKATVGSGELRVTYRWIEPVYRDGKERNLNFTYIGGPLVEEQPEELRSTFIASVKRVLNKVTVRVAGGGTKLAYTTPTGGKSTIPFKAVRGC